MPVRDLGILFTTTSSSTPTHAAQQPNCLTGFTHAVFFMSALSAAAKPFPTHFASRKVSAR
jgi:hypothetical protein